MKNFTLSLTILSSLIAKVNRARRKLAKENQSVVEIRPLVLGWSRKLERKLGSSASSRAGAVPPGRRGAAWKNAYLQRSLADEEDRSEVGSNERWKASIHRLAMGRFANQKGVRERNIHREVRVNFFNFSTYILFQIRFNSSNPSWTCLEFYNSS